MKKKRISWLRIFISTLIVTSVGSFIIWDYSRVNTDFENTMAFLKEIWTYTGITGQQLIAKFEGDNIIVTHGNSGKLYDTLTVPTLHQVNYETTLGKDMIVYTGGGTSAHNINPHGGDITLKSRLGFKKSIAINCNGPPSKGR